MQLANNIIKVLLLADGIYTLCTHVWGDVGNFTVNA